MRILYAEDEKRILRNTSERLEKDGFSVDMAENGLEAWHYLESVGYDLAILDIMMPKMDGLEVLRKIREAGMKTPVIMLTALSSVEDRIEGLDAGADDYLPKPFAYAELVARIRALLRRPALVAHENKLFCGEIEMDIARHKVSSRGQEVELARKEFAVLEYLMRNKNIVVTREQIESSVWNFDYDAASNVIDVYIRYLRKKLDPDGQYIQTVRGVGYVARCEE